MEDSLSTPDLSIDAPDRFCFVRCTPATTAPNGYHVLTAAKTRNSFLPESPRWLITKDRAEEAQAILSKYHGETDGGTEFVAAEMAQMQTTIRIELEAAKKSWFHLFETAGMRRRLLITTMLGLFTQWSGNTLIS